jgi:hypothetical protein
MFLAAFGHILRQTLKRAESASDLRPDADIRNKSYFI